MKASVISSYSPKDQSKSGGRGHYKQHGLDKANAVIEDLSPALVMDIYYGTNHLIQHWSLNLETV
jgi:hypothetical protein